MGGGENYFFPMREIHFSDHERTKKTFHGLEFFLKSKFSITNCELIN
jgi:hypothetical protein